jgi:hypothetical protein
MSKDERLEFYSCLIEQRKVLSESLGKIHAMKNKTLDPLNVYDCEVVATQNGAYVKFGEALSAAESRGYSRAMREAAVQRYKSAVTFMEQQAHARLADIEAALARL